MSYAAFKMTHLPTGIEHCAAAFLTHSPYDAATSIAPPPLLADELESAETPLRRQIGPIPNLVVAAANVLEVYVIRTQDASRAAVADNQRRGGASGAMDGLSGAQLELVCHYRLHGNVQSLAVLPVGAENRNRQRDSIVLTFQDAKITVLEYEDSAHMLSTSSMHCFEGPDWLHLKRGRETFAVGPVVKTDPLGRCCGALVYGLQMVILKTALAGQSVVEDDEQIGAMGTLSPRIESSYVIGLRSLNVNHVKDFTFIHGYIEPVLVILHENEPTWAGRIPWKHHTCMIMAYSINTTLQQHPLIWSSSNLPHDAYKLLAVPSPIDGVLVICANTIHYHSQSASCSLELNSYSSKQDSSLEMPKANFFLELDAANATWLSHDVAMFSSKTGDLLLLTLVNDGRTVQRLDLTKSKASVLSSGVASIGSSFFFLGSRLGDSLLVQYSCRTSTSMSTYAKEEVVADLEVESHFSKRLRHMASDQDITSLEELSLHTTASNSLESAQKSFSFVVRDSLVNVGPLRDFTYGLRINADPAATGIAKQSNYELVCCSGHGKNGAVSVLLQSVRPDLITEVELPGCKGIWTVYHKSSRSLGNDSAKTSDEDEYHSYLIISLESRTMVLETGDDLGEVTETVDYYVHGSTIAAGNLFGRRRVVQIYSKGARLLDGSYMTQELVFNFSNSEVASNFDSPSVSTVSIADPYVLLKMTDGTIQFLVGDASTCTLSVMTPNLCSSSKGSVSACTLYHDKGPEPWLRKTSTDAWLSVGVSETIDGNDSLYEEGDIYCVLCFESGKLEILDVPNFKCVFAVDSFVCGKNLLMDSSINDPVKSDSNTEKTAEGSKVSDSKELLQGLKIVEIALHRWSGLYSRPFLFAVLNDGTVLCYHAYFHEAQENNTKESVSSPHKSNDADVTVSCFRNLRFIRSPIDVTTCDETTDVAQPRIAIFNNVAGYQGFFLAGSRPAWFLVCRQRLRVHPQLCDGSVVAFAVLHNVNCNHGLIYVTAQGYLKICQLPAQFNYDNYWPVQKIPLLATPHQITYYAERNLYPLIVSFPVVHPLNQVLATMADHDMMHYVDGDTANSEDIQQSYYIDEFEIRILEPQKSGHWETRSTIPMQTFENALTVRVVTVHNTTTKENESLLVVGTAYVQGEDVAARGRVLLFSFSKSTEPPQNPVFEVYSKEHKGAVSAVASLQGHLLIASGPKITLNKWSGTELISVAFYDAPLHVVSINIVKNFILFGDIHKSIFFLSWKEQGAQLSLLGKDFDSLDCFATEFLIDGTTLSLVVSDSHKNIQIFYYAPKMLESWKGQKLLSRVEFHAGSHVSKFLRLQMLSTPDRASTVAGVEKTNRFALLFSTLDGGIGCIAPLDEITFRRLQNLQKKLVNSVPHFCGLNPRSFRQFRSPGIARRPGPDNMIDFEVLYWYERMSVEEQLEIAQQIGTTRSQILSNYTDFALGTSFL